MCTEELPSPLNRLDQADRVVRRLQRGETLFRQDTPTAGMFFLVSGVIDLMRTTTEGHNVLIHRARTGHTFAEASIFSATYHCTAIAVNDTILIECKRAAILKLLGTDIDFTHSIAADFAAQLQQSRRRVELLSIKAADERVINALSDGLLVEDITTFATSIGLAAETVYRTLSKLSKSGQIQKTARGHYQIMPVDSDRAG